MLETVTDWVFNKLHLVVNAHVQYIHSLPCVLLFCRHSKQMQCTRCSTVRAVNQHVDQGVSCFVADKQPFFHPSHHNLLLAGHRSHSLQFTVHKLTPQNSSSLTQSPLHH